MQRLIGWVDVFAAIELALLIERGQSGHLLCLRKVDARRASPASMSTSGASDHRARAHTRAVGSDKSLWRRGPLIEGPPFWLSRRRAVSGGVPRRKIFARLSALCLLACRCSSRPVSLSHFLIGVGGAGRCFLLLSLVISAGQPLLALTFDASSLSVSRRRRRFVCAIVGPHSWSCLPRCWRAMRLFAACRCCSIVEPLGESVRTWRRRRRRGRRSVVRAHAGASDC